MEEVEITEVYSGDIDRHKRRNDTEFARETGFPSPARDHYERPLSLDEHLIHRPSATFFMRIKGDNMRKDGIHSDDILVVNRSIEPANGHLVVVFLNGEQKIRRLERLNGNLYFCCSDESDKNIAVSNDLDHSIWGVVSYTIHKRI